MNKSTQQSASFILNWIKQQTQLINWPSIIYGNNDIRKLKNDLTHIATTFNKGNTIFYSEIFEIKNHLFTPMNTLDPLNVGRLGEVLKIILNMQEQQNNDIWTTVHPRIKRVSQKLYLDGHYSNAACDAFIEINDRVKKIFALLRPNDSIPDGKSAMNTVFSAKNPLIKLADLSTDTGINIQEGFMSMLAGAMSALRNPKSHANLPLAQEEAMRRIQFASMLMFKIDEGVAYSQIKEIDL